MPSRAVFSMADFGGEVSSASVNIEPITAGTLANIQTEVTALKDAIDAVTLGIYLSEELTVQSRFAGTGSRSNQEEADRELKWLVTYQDISPTLGVGVENPGYFKVFSFEIPTANLSLRTDGDVVFSKGGGLSVEPWTTLINAIEDIVRSPYMGLVEVLEIRSVGRNL